MRKTSVYLSDEEAAALQRAAALAGKAQSELIREGVRKVIAEIDFQPRTFRSRAQGHGGGQPYARWTSNDLYRKAMGRTE